MSPQEKGVKHEAPAKAKRGRTRKAEQEAPAAATAGGRTMRKRVKKEPK